MKLFSMMYNLTMRWAAHRHAPRYLAGLSFAESSFFPIPPDVMLAPMALARPERAWHLALLTTLASVLGGVLGYALGYFLFDILEPYILKAGYGDEYQTVQAWFGAWGFWAVFLAGFSPVPYKIFTIGAGVIGMSPFAFVAASVISRGSRFFLVAGLMVWGGERMEQALRRYVDRVGWVLVVMGVAGYFIFNGSHA